MKKFLFANKCSLVSADAEDANYPASNLLTDKIGQLWKGTSSTGTLTAVVSDGNNVVTLHNTNAETIQVTVKNTAETSTLWGPSTFTLESGADFLLGNMWADYTVQSGAVHIIMLCTADAGSTIEAGIVRAGTADVYRNPQYGMSESLVDRGVRKKLNDGSIYYHKIGIVRNFSGKLLLARDTNCRELMRRIQLQGGDPLSCLVTDLDAEDWSLWCRLQMPKSQHDYFAYSSLPITIEECGQTLRAHD